MQNEIFSLLTFETQIHLSDGMFKLLEYLNQNIADLSDMDFNLAKKFYVKRRAEFLQQSGERFYISHACEDIGRTRDYYYDNHLAGNL